MLSKLSGHVIRIRRNLRATKAAALNHLALRYKTSGDYALAESLYKESIEIRRAALGEQHPDYAQSLNNLGMLYYEIGNYADAEPLFNQAIDIYRRACGEDSDGLGYGLNNLGLLYSMTGRYEDAERLYGQALEIWGKTGGDEHPEIGKLLNNLAGLYEMLGRYADADRLLTRAGELIAKNLGEAHPDFALYLCNHGRLSLLLEDYAKYQAFCARAAEVISKTLGEKHYFYGIALNNLAQARFKLGDYNAAESLYKRALHIHRNSVGENHPEYLSTINNLGQLYAMRGDYADSEAIANELAGRFKATFCGDPAQAAIGIHNLAMIYFEVGNYEAAHRYLVDALMIVVKRLGENAHLLALIYNGLAKVYREVNIHTLAISLYQEAIRINSDLLGEGSEEVIGGLVKMAHLYAGVGDLAKAEEIWKRAFGNESGHFNFLQVLKGNIVECMPAYKRAVERARKSYGEYSRELAQGLENLAFALAASGGGPEALEAIEESARIYDRMIGQVFSFSPDAQRIKFVESIRSSFEAFLNLVLRYLPDSVRAVRSAFELALRRKGLTAEAWAMQQDAIRQARESQHAQKWAEIAALQEQITQATFSGISTDESDVYKNVHWKAIAEWKDKKEKIEAELARASSDVSIAHRLRTITCEQMADSLPEDAVLIEFTRFDFIDIEKGIALLDSPRAPARYLAFVMPARNADAIEMIDLGEAAPIDRMISSFLAAITGQPDETVIRDMRMAGKVEAGEASLGRDIRQAIFDPLRAALDKRERLLISPDGDLARLPFEVLPTESGQRLIDEYKISYLSTGRDLLCFEDISNHEPTAALVIADPDFNLELACSAPGVSRNEREIPRFSDLPGTAREGKQVSALLGAELWTRGEVLESRLKARQSPSILHLATHGFFLKDQKRESSGEADRFRLIGEARSALGKLDEAHLENPLMRSGLALAGANTWLEGRRPPAEAEDGLLTAQDVAMLNLRGTQLVVLSACKTGVGDIRVGEGVFGLRRAVALAGAKTLIMSLWNVPDDETNELMSRFYESILKGSPVPEALRAAQLAIRARRPDPLYWGAFICQGYSGSIQL